MKYKLFLFAILAFSVMYFTSCKEEEILIVNEKYEVEETTIDDNVSFENGKLNFSSLDFFKEVVCQLKSNNNLDISENLSLCLGDKNYQLLKECKEKRTKETDEEELVDDPEFQSLLNEKNEIQVENVVYRITPQGTFVYIAEKEEEVDAIVEILNAGDSISEIQTDDYFYEVKPGIARYDTFKEVHENTLDLTYEIGPLVTDISHNPQTGYTEDITNHVFEDNHTIVGSWLQNTFGFNASYTRKISDKRRIKVSFSCPNFVLFTYINAKVVYQKKNWIGWSGTSCPKLVLGWDGLTYKFENGASNMPNPPQGLNPKWPRIESHFPVTNKEYLSLYVPNLELIHTNRWKVSFSPHLTIDEKLLCNAYKKLFNWAKSKLSPSEMTEYVAIMPNANKVYVGKDEFIEINKEKISKTFNYAIGQISATFSIDNGQWGGFMIKPMEFKVLNASIYGKAYVNGKCMGIRIEKR